MINICTFKNFFLINGSINDITIDKIATPVVIIPAAEEDVN